jgi:hypothetical protein
MNVFERIALHQPWPRCRAGRTAQSISPDAAREAGPGLIAEDLPEVLPGVFRRLYDEFGVDY